MFNIDDITNEDIMGHNPNWPQSPGYPQIILICGGSESGKTNALLNSITNQLDFDKIYLYDKDPYKAKYQLLINKSRGLTCFNDSETFVEYLNDMDDIHKNIEESTLNKK